MKSLFSRGSDVREVMSTMEVRDYIQLGAILITFLVTILNLVYSYFSSKKIMKTNAEMAEKSRLVDVATVRRKERMERFVDNFSKVVALSHPLTMQTYVRNTNENFTLELLNSYENMNMLLGLNFEKDVEISSRLGKIVEEAIKYYDMMTINNSMEREEYLENYVANVQSVRKMLNVFMGAEWGRIKKESKTGEQVGYDEWIQIYNKVEGYYDKWNGSKQE